MGYSAQIGYKCWILGRNALLIGTNDVFEFAISKRLGGFYPFEIKFRRADI
jgi:hypothetical protein